MCFEKIISTASYINNNMISNQVKIITGIHNKDIENNLIC